MPPFDFKFTMQWNDVFWFLSIMSLALAISQFGLPYASFGFVSRFNKFRGKSQMRMREFIGRISIFFFLLFIVLLAYFIFASLHTGAILLQAIFLISNTLTWIITIILTIAIYFVIGRWIKNQWDATSEIKECKEPKQLTDEVTRLVNTVEQLTTSIKQREVQTDRLIKLLENRHERYYKQK